MSMPLPPDPSGHDSIAILPLLEHSLPFDTQIAIKQVGRDVFSCHHVFDHFPGFDLLPFDLFAGRCWESLIRRAVPLVVPFTQRSPRIHPLVTQRSPSVHPHLLG